MEMADGGDPGQWNDPLHRLSDVSVGPHRWWRRWRLRGQSVEPGRGLSFVLLCLARAIYQQRKFVDPAGASMASRLWFAVLPAGRGVWVNGCDRGRFSTSYQEWCAAVDARCTRAARTRGSLCHARDRRQYNLDRNECWSHVESQLERSELEQCPVDFARSSLY